MSVPAETPEEVATGPSSTQRAAVTHFTRSLWLRASWKNILFEVARRPSSRPALASSADPEQTDIVSSASAERLRRKSSSAALPSCASVPMPPGSSTRSSRGQSPKSWCATVSTPGVEATAPLLSATVTMRISFSSAPNISSGP